MTIYNIYIYNIYIHIYIQRLQTVCRQVWHSKPSGVRLAFPSIPSDLCTI